MDIKWILMLSLNVFSSLAFSTEYESCCFCITEEYTHEDYKFLHRECNTWFRKENRNSQCDLKKEYTKISAEFSKSSDDHCKKIRIFGTFHGLSKDTNLPFTFSKKIAERYKASEVCYDGSTCLIFNNSQFVIAEAEKLSSSTRDTTYKISGNQNVGIVSCTPIGSYFPKENMSQASKMIATINAFGASVTYGECSKVNKQCYHIPAGNDEGYYSDSNSKFCISNNQTLQQFCCPKANDPKTVIGFWHKPNRKCHEQ